MRSLSKEKQLTSVPTGVYKGPTQISVPGIRHTKTSPRSTSGLENILFRPEERCRSVSSRYSEAPRPFRFGTSKGERDPTRGRELLENRWTVITPASVLHLLRLVGSVGLVLYVRWVESKDQKTLKRRRSKTRGKFKDEFGGPDQVRWEKL